MTASGVQLEKDASGKLGHHVATKGVVTRNISLLARAGAVVTAVNDDVLAVDDRMNLQPVNFYGSGCTIVDVLHSIQILRGQRIAGRGRVRGHMGRFGWPDARLALNGIGPNNVALRVVSPCQAMANGKQSDG
jgi:hypothetical protein